MRTGGRSSARPRRRPDREAKRIGYLWEEDARKLREKLKKGSSGDWTVSELLRWWLQVYSSQLASHERNVQSVEKHLTPAPFGDVKLRDLHAGHIEELLQAKGATLKPQSVNHVRLFLVRAFSKAIAARKWNENPAKEVKARKVQKNRRATTSAPTRWPGCSPRCLLTVGRSSPPASASV